MELKGVVIVDDHDLALLRLVSRLLLMLGLESLGCLDLIALQSSVLDAGFLVASTVLK